MRPAGICGAVRRVRLRLGGRRRRSRLRQALRSAAAIRVALGRLRASRHMARSTSSISGAGRSGRAVPSDGGCLLDPLRGLEHGRRPVRVEAGERLPEQDADGPHVRLRARRLSLEALGRDVRERAGHVAGGRERVGLVEERQAEVEEAHGDAVLVVGQQHVRRLDVAVDDPELVRVREPFENLRTGLHRSTVVQPAGTQGVAERLAGDVLVRDVRVLGVRSEISGFQAALVVEARRGLVLALGARGRLSFTRDDLERDLVALELVPGEPDGARAAAAERLDGAVATEDQFILRDSDGGGRHRTVPWPRARKVLSIRAGRYSHARETHERARQRDRLRLLRGAGARAGRAAAAFPAAAGAARSERRAAAELHAAAAAGRRRRRRDRASSSCSCSSSTAAAATARRPSTATT